MSVFLQIIIIFQHTFCATIVWMVLNARRVHIGVIASRLQLCQLAWSTATFLYVHVSPLPILPQRASRHLFLSRLWRFPFIHPKAEGFKLEQLLRSWSVTCTRRNCFSYLSDIHLLVWVAPTPPYTCLMCSGEESSSWIIHEIIAAASKLWQELGRVQTLKGCSQDGLPT